MQAIKEKLNDMGAMRKAKAEAKEEENAEKELAKARVEVAHEVRMAREAEAAMDLHVSKAVDKVAEHDRKHAHDSTNHEQHSVDNKQNPNLSNPSNVGHSTDPTYGEGTQAPYITDMADLGSAAAGTGGPTSRPGGRPANNLL
ncbi:late [Abeliophyllum distichum]|uniref:Late n=1 Tax=Abeliophyllum distichum TaxID=126358 RepID=A0ABD1TFS1_9LAMI